MLCCQVASVMSDSVWPHGLQPTRLLHPWDSPGKNTGVGCHFLLQCMKVKGEVTQSCLTLRDPMDCSLPGSSIHGIFRATVLEWGAIVFSQYMLYIQGKICMLRKDTKIWGGGDKTDFLDLKNTMCEMEKCAKSKKKIHNPKIIMRKTLEIPIEGYSIKCCSCCLVAVLSDSLVTPGTVAHQASLSMRFFRQEYWSGLPFPSPGELPDLEMEPASPAHVSCIAGRFFYC